MEKASTLNATLIAPCGMNCGICLGFQREKNRCEGCTSNSDKKPNYCKTCVIKNCALLNETESKFCYECITYPCKRLKQLDKRYRTRYAMSMLENLNFIKTSGLNAFLTNESIRWKCITCDGYMCVHRGYCLRCTSQKSK
jgi:hypothetical protein